MVVDCKTTVVNSFQVAGMEGFPSLVGRTPWPNSTGFFTRGDIMYVGMGSYGHKKAGGAAAMRIDASTTPWTGKVLWHAPEGCSWRGIVWAQDRIVIPGGGHSAVIIDSKTGKVLHKVSLSGIDDRTKTEAHYGKAARYHANNPTAVGKMVYMPIWSGHTAVLDVTTGKVVSVNRPDR